MSADAFLAAWGALTADVASLVDTALDVEPPGGVDEAWAAWLARCEVAALGDDARLEAFARDGLTKGVPLAEVRACLEAVCRLAVVRLSPLRATLSPPQAAAVDAALHELTSTALEHYRRAASERKKKLFAHAKKLAAQHRYDGHAAAQRYVLGCGACGAPRLGEALTCVYCGAPL